MLIDIDVECWEFVRDYVLRGMLIACGWYFGLFAFRSVLVVRFIPFKPTTSYVNLLLSRIVMEVKFKGSCSKPLLWLSWIARADVIGFLYDLLLVRECGFGRLGPLDHVYASSRFATEVTLIRLLDYAFCIILIEDAIG